jgi:putative spermidine/putrescine transport system substrate-binding protein
MSLVQRRMNRKWVAAGLVSVAAVLLSGCAGNAPSTEGADSGSADSGSVNLMAYSGIFEDNYTAAVVEAFEKKYPDIDVTFSSKVTSAEMLGTLRSEKGNPRTDVAILDTSVADAGIKEGLFAKVSDSDVPNLANVVKSGQNADGYGPAVTFDSFSLIYDTDKFPTAPTSWEALWDTKNLALSAPPNIQGLALTIVASELVGADYTKGIEPAVKKLASLAPNAATWQPQPDAFQMVIAGTATAGTGWNARGQTFADQSDGKLGVVLPKEGTVFQTNTINLIEGSPNESAARTFINYALSSEAQLAFAEAMYYAPTVTNVVLPDDVASRMAGDQDRIIDLDWKWMSGQRDAWTDAWRRNVIKG